MMHRYHPLARRELFDAARFYEEKQAGLGEKFLAAVREGITSVSSQPYTWPVISGRLRRRVLTSRFPFSIVYTVIEGKVFIVAIAHQSRSEDYWRSRID